MKELSLQELQSYCPLGIDLEKEIGRGSYGRVYKLKDKDEVIKVLDPAKPCPDRRLEPKDYEQFKTELDYACRITHLKNPNLMPVLGVYSHVIQPQDDEKRMIFMLHMPLRKNLMELAEEKIKARARPKEDDIIRIVCDLCHGLESLHQEKVVIEGKGSTMEKLSFPGPMIHGDIKPDNVFIDDVSKGVRYYQLGDFGACFRTGNGWIPGQKLYSNIHYTAPETRNEDIGPAYDVFSLGFMLYWWMNGWQHPEKARKARFDSDFKQRFRLLNMSPELWRVFMKATAESWQNRYSTAAEMRKALERAQKARNARILEEEKQKSEKEGIWKGIKKTLLMEAKIGAAAAVAVAAWQLVSHLACTTVNISGILSHLLPNIGIDATNIRNRKPDANTAKASDSSGQHRVKNDLLYEGDFANGAAEGTGSLRFPDGGVFTGRWKAGAIDESVDGVYTFVDGSSLSGRWRYIDESGSYTGLLLNGEYAGWGMAQFKMGGKYCGEFKNGFPDGWGSYTACDETIFSGNWSYAVDKIGYSGMLLDGLPCGQGICKLPDGSRYFGEFRDGLPMKSPEHKIL